MQQPQDARAFPAWNDQFLAANTLNVEIQAAAVECDYDNMTEFWHGYGSRCPNVSCIHPVRGPHPRCIDLCPFDAKSGKDPMAVKKVGEVQYRMKRGITMDSCAGDNVIPRRMVNATRIRPSAGSKCGLRYVAATGEKIDNEGEVDLNFITSEGFSESWPFQVANVNKPLGAVADRVDNKCRVVYDQDDDGRDLSYILDKPSGRIMKIRRTGKVWILDAVVAKDMISLELFSRQG
jgi:hypothetical protein